MSNNKNIRIYAWIELLIWILIVVFTVFGIRYHHYQNQKQYKSYQIFMEDVDGLIVGSPVRYLGVQIGYIKKIQVVSNQVYVKFAITKEGLTLPTGVIATVEAFGLAGSKALELYPPNKDEFTDKIIITKDPTRLGRVMGLFMHIFQEIDAIIAVGTHTSTELSPEIQNANNNKGEFKQTTNKINNISNTIKHFINTKNELSKNSKNKIKENKNESEQSKSNK